MSDVRKECAKPACFFLSSDICPLTSGSRRTFCIMGQRVDLASELKPIGGGAAKASLNRAFQFVGSDPKPGDLAMGRLKVG
jgi:hypothetical protein